MSLLALAGWLLAGLAALVLLALIMLLAPFRLYLRFATTPPRFELSLRLFGGLLPQMRLMPRPAKAEKPPSVEPAEPTDSPETKKPKVKKPRSKVVGRALWALPRLIASIPAALRIDQLRLHTTFGTDDPALTGEIYGALTPVLYGTHGIGRLDLQVQPDFRQSVFAAEAEAALRIAPLSLVGPLLRFGWACYGPRR